MPQRIYSPYLISDMLSWELRFSLNRLPMEPGPCSQLSPALRIPDYQSDTNSADLVGIVVRSRYYSLLTILHS